jgi:Ca2+-binding RTX toxin-like protein
VENNIIVNNLTSGPIGIANRHPSVIANISNNHFYGLTSSQIVTGLNTQSGNDTLAQAPAIDTSHPWSANPWDTLIWSGAAENTLTGTSGHDLFAGSSGNDTFVIRAGGNSDTIAGFDDSGGNDVVRLEGYGLSSFAGVKAAMTQQGSDVVLHFGNGETLTFQDKTIGSFTAADFTFSTTISTSSYTPPPPSTTSDKNVVTTQSTVTTVAHITPFKLPETGAYVNNFVGTSANNVLTGTSANDNLYGRGGDDTMSGGAGDDTYHVENNGDKVIENANSGTDTVISTIASYTLTANVENLALSGSSNQTGNGNALNNIISAGAGNDTLNGGDGNDILSVGTGAYKLTGGTGNDIFSFTKSNGGLSTITDFHIGEDLIDMRKIFSDAHYKGTDPMGDHTMTVASDGHGGSLISIDLAHTGTMHALVDVQGTDPGSLYVGLDVLWH